MFDHKPPNLNPEAAYIWDWYSTHLRNAEIYPIGCAPQFAQLCMYEAFLAKHDMLNMPLSNTDNDGRSYPNSDLLMYDKIMARVQILWARLALNPIYLWQAPPSINLAPQPSSSRVMLYLPDNGRNPSQAQIQELPPRERDEEEDIEEDECEEDEFEEEPIEEQEPAEAVEPPAVAPVEPEPEPVEPPPPVQSAQVTLLRPRAAQGSFARWKALAD
jgi:hypothetical protein